MRNQPWRVLARENQLPPPGDWRTWLLLAGRGFGKTRTGAEWVHANIDRYARWHLVGPTASAVRDVMVEGESGVLATAPNAMRPKYEPSKLRLTWPNGSVAALFSAEEPDRLRGPQCEAAWAEEVATWPYQDAWDQLQLGLRLGPDPRQVVTTTPRPIALIRELMADPNTAVTRGTTYENRANLAAAFFSQIIRKYEGTTLGRQELYAELLEQVDGSLWSMDDIKHALPPQRFIQGVLQAAYQRTVVSVDPSATSHGDMCGIAAAGLGIDGKGYVIADRSVQGSPTTWATAGVKLYKDVGAGVMLVEGNQGGEMARLAIHTVDPNVNVKLITAVRSKWDRAEPVQALYEQSRVFHVETLPDLEAEMCRFTLDIIAKESPNRVDAVVHALTDLMLASGWGSGGVGSA